MSAGRVTVVTASSPSPVVAVFAVESAFICWDAGMAKVAFPASGVPLMAGDEPQNL
jgi:hypothetical protein